MASTVIVLFLAYVAHVSIAQDNLQDFQRTRYQCWHQGRWVAEGGTVERGRYYYECVQGRQEPRGCLDESGRRLRLNENQIALDGFEHTCRLDPSGYLSFPLTACVFNSRRYRPGETWENYQGTAWYTCKQVTDWHLRVDLEGCVKDGRRLKLDESLDMGAIYETCKMQSDGSAKVACKGCINDGRRYKIGETWPDGDFVYYCRVRGEKCSASCIGCTLPSGDRLSHGDRYHKEQSVFQCDITPDDYAHRLIGCVGRDRRGVTVERVLGCEWYEEAGPEHLNFYSCLEKGGYAVKRFNACIYRENGKERLMIDPKSYTTYYSRMHDKEMGFACEETYDGEYRLTVFDPEEQKRISNRLTFAFPRGR